MLVLTRKIGQQVLIAQGAIQVKVLNVDNDKISLGFYAPDHIDIDREEVFFKKNQCTQQSAYLQGRRI